MILSRAKNIFMPANVNSIVIFITKKLLRLPDILINFYVFVPYHSFVFFIRAIKARLTAKELPVHPYYVLLDAMSLMAKTVALAR